jgi:hypothetical protein
MSSPWCPSMSRSMLNVTIRHQTHMSPSTTDRAISSLGPLAHSVLSAGNMRQMYSYYSIGAASNVCCMGWCWSSRTKGTGETESITRKPSSPSLYHVVGPPSMGTTIPQKRTERRYAEAHDRTCYLSERPEDRLRRGPAEVRALKGSVKCSKPQGGYHTRTWSGGQ